MLLAGITVSQGACIRRWRGCRGDGGNGGVGAELPYRPADGAHRLVTRFTSKHAISSAVQHQLQKNGVIVLFTSRFLAVLRYIVPLAAGCSG
jgi:hypothetical protein